MLVTRKGSIRSLVCFSLLVVLPGCGGVYDASVTGVVTLDSTLITRGTVSFIPSGTGPQAYGLVAEDGSYSLMTGRENGLPSGDYTVTVVANEPSTPDPNGGPPTPGKTITPAWYRTKKTSDLKVTLEPGSNTINLELKSEPPPDWKPPKQKRRRR